MSKKSVENNILNDYNQLCIITMKKITELSDKQDFYNYFDEIIAMTEYPIKCGKKIHCHGMVKYFTQVKNSTLQIKNNFNKFQ